MYLSVYSKELLKKFHYMHLQHLENIVEHIFDENNNIRKLLQSERLLNIDQS